MKLREAVCVFGSAVPSQLPLDHVHHVKLIPCHRGTQVAVASTHISVQGWAHGLQRKQL